MNNHQTTISASEGGDYVYCRRCWYVRVRGILPKRVTAAMRALMTRAVARGELPHDALARFPQLLIAPALVAVVWSSLFERFAPLDVRELMRAHIDILFGQRSAT